MIDLASYDNINKAITHSEEIFQQLKEARESRQNTLNDYICVFVVGSYGRFEASSKSSDIEWLIVFDDTKVRIQEANIFQAQITESIAELVGRDRISIGKTFGEVIGISDLSINVGGIADTSRTLTYRILCLAEGTPLEKNNCYNTIMSNLAYAYGHSHTAGHRMLSFATDISRYWRTLRIDYKQKIDEEKKHWAIRGFKLRGTRRYWYFSMVLHFIVFGPRLSDYESIEDDGNNFFDFDVVKKFMISLSNNPSIRIKNAVAKFVFEGDLMDKLFKLYDDYIRIINDFDNRQSLDKLNFEERYKNKAYIALKSICIKMHSIMADIIISLPEFYRRQAIEMFLL